MSQRQRMLLCFLLAHCSGAQNFAQLEYYTEALGWCTHAEEIAAALGDRGAQIDLHVLRGTLHRGVSDFWLAADEWSTACHQMREYARDGESLDPEFEITVAAKAASIEYLLGDFERAFKHVEQAAKLIPLATVSLEGKGTVEWTRALIRRQLNEPFEALRHIEEAVNLYRQVGAGINADRVLTVAAEIALDVATAMTQEDLPRDPGSMLALAEEFIQDALTISEMGSDVTGAAMARLALARLVRMRDGASAEGVEKIIRDVQQFAEAEHDNALLAGAQTAMGIDLIVQGKRAEGKKWLQEAVLAAERLHTPSLAFQARRILLQEEEEDG